MHPDIPIFITEHNQIRLDGVAPVFLHQEISGHSEFTAGIDGQDIIMVRGVNDLCLDMGHEAADSVDAFIEGVICRGHRRDGACLCHAIADGQFCEVEHLV